jgi:formylglycine-generating enzyme required for sulfatase activity
LRRTITPPRPTPPPEPSATSRGSKPTAPSRAAEPEDLPVIQDGDFAPELVVLAPGVFMMGSTEPERRWAIEQGSGRGWVDVEKPQHRVAIPKPFAVGKYALTRGQFAAFVEATAHNMSGGCAIFDETGDKWEHSPMADWRSPGFGWQTDHHPVVGVSWEDAKAYVEWLGRETGQPYRLPSEAEWEYACRAGTTTAYHVGSGITHFDANFGNKVGKTVEVGSYAPNDWGLYDMHGNVWEWVDDCRNDSYKGAPEDGSAWASGDCSRRVLRGGSWGFDPGDLRSARRGRVLPDLRVNGLGFRVARTLSGSESVTP